MAGEWNEASVAASSTVRLLSSAPDRAAGALTTQAVGSIARRAVGGERSVAAWSVAAWLRKRSSGTFDWPVSRFSLCLLLEFLRDQRPAPR